jgi:signal transduction histidine kinase
MRPVPPALGSLLLVIAPLLVAIGRGRRRDDEGAGLRAEHIALQRQHAALHAEVDRLTRQVRAVEHERDEFLATLSHELRSPLNAMLGWIELLRIHLKDPAQQAHAIDVIERNARAEVRIIGDLLDLARLATHRLCIERQPVSLRALVGDAAGCVETAAAARSTALHVDASEDVWVMGDAARLRQALTHLLHNAFKFTDPGGTVGVSLRCDDGTAIVEIADTGIGMAADTLALVFDRFRQGERGLTRRFGGLGAGLTIVRAVVELHGGTVEAASEGLGKGSTFTVRLPATGPCLAQ